MDKIQKRFDELAEQANVVDQSIRISNQAPQNDIDRESADFYSDAYECIDGEKFISWQTSTLSLLARVFGEESQTFKEFRRFADREEIGHVRPRLHKAFRQMKAAFLSAKQQFEGGYLFDVQNLIHAEVFSNELDQAVHFLDSKFEVAAAVTAGVVLETTIKKLCSQQTPEINVINPAGKDIKTDTLISELKNAGVYNEAVAKQLRAWMNVRNDAAHGKRKDGEFDDGEVKRMIEGVSDFVAKHMS